MTATETTRPARRRAARQPRVITTVLTTRIPVELMKRLDKRAEERDVTTSELVRQMLDAALVGSPQTTLFG